MEERDDLKNCTDSKQEERIRTEANTIAIKAVQPMLDENIRLQSVIAKRDEQIKKLQNYIDELKNEIDEFPRKLSPSDRDNPITPKYSIDNGMTNWYCPVCNSLVSNWENYCLHCGQRLGERLYNEDKQ